MPLSWMIINHVVYCYEDPQADCHVHTLVEPDPVFLTESEVTFHDPTLAAATKEINTILVRASRSDTANGRRLRLITTPDGLMLAWAECGDAVGPRSDGDAVRRALGLGAAPPAAAP
ncbi:MAG TPA: hypothetical protein VGD67_16810 [Pseudonocardiaceae bacterium]